MRQVVTLTFTVLSVGLLFFMWLESSEKTTHNLNDDDVVKRKSILRPKIKQSREETKSDSLPREPAKIENPTKKKLTTSNPQNHSEMLEKGFENLKKEFFGKELSGDLKLYQIAVQSNDRWILHGDIMVDPSNLVLTSKQQGMGAFNTTQVNFWQGGLIPFEIDSAPGSAFFERVFDAIKEIEKSTDIRFVEVDKGSQQNFVVFTETQDEVCLSYLGRKGGPQKVILGPNCTFGSILHEILHVIGLVHEHSRQDRDEHLILNVQNIEASKIVQFQKLPLLVSNPFSQPFDLNSILLYGSYAFSKNKKPTLLKKNGETFQENRRYLSDIDIIKVNSLASIEVTD